MTAGTPGRGGLGEGHAMAVDRPEHLGSGKSLTSALPVRRDPALTPSSRRGREAEGGAWRVEATEVRGSQGWGLVPGVDPLPRKALYKDGVLDRGDSGLERGQDHFIRPPGPGVTFSGR